MTMTPQQEIETAVRAALKAGDKLRLGTLRMLLTDVKNLRIEVGREIDEAELVTLARKAIKRRHDAAEGFRKGGREESAVKEEAEAVILAELLPPALDEDTLSEAIREFVAAEGLQGLKGMGPVMKAMKERYGSQADGATLSRIAREVLAETS